MKILKIFTRKKGKKTDDSADIIQKEEAENRAECLKEEDDDGIIIYYLPKKINEAIKIAIKDFASDHRLKLEYEPNKTEYKKIFNFVNSLITRENVVKFFRTIFETEDEVVFTIDFPTEIVLERNNASFVIEKIILTKEDGCRCGVEIISKPQKRHQNS